MDTKTRWVVLWKRHLIGFSFGFALLLNGAPATANIAQPLENPWTLCAKHTQKQERAKRIPSRLLRAISLAESGRWRTGNREISAWPWTVMAEGEGRFFESKRAALAWVRALKARGIKNIDVGCMQVNLNYHGHHFPSLEHAMDPATNTAYAAKFLRQKYAAARSWSTAAGHYHSTDPEHNRPYRNKVLKFWRDTGTVPQAAQQTAQQTRAPQRSVSPHQIQAANRFWRPAVDHERTTRLNSRFKKAKLAARKKPLAFRSGGKIRTARKSFNDKIQGDFRLRRQAQLKRWRRANHWQNQFIR